MEKDQILYNISIHNKIAKKYEGLHGEIYNEVEQLRLKKSLEKAVQSVETGNNSCLLALDFGCGAGNLTKHLTDLGCQVLAVDVSVGFLDLVASRSYKKKVTTVKLNGVNLDGIPNASVDIVAMYSVLHHIPDYLSLIKEFSRVLKPGGILYIDHEAASSVWNSIEYVIFLEEMAKKLNIAFKKYFIFANYINKFISIFKGSRYRKEGDVHVFNDDHIEWNEIVGELTENNISLIKEYDYLLYKRDYDNEIYNKWKDKIGDIHLLIGRKNEIVIKNVN